MEPLKKILRTPSALVLLLIAIVSLIGVIIKSQSDMAIARLPIEATSTAEAKLTEIANILVATSTQQTDPTNLGTPADTVFIPDTAPTIVDTTRPNNIVSVGYTVDLRDMFLNNGFVLPDNIQPVLGSLQNPGADDMSTAVSGWDFPFWPNAPAEYLSGTVPSGQMTTYLSVSFVLTATNSNAAWIKIDSAMQLSIVRDSVPESVQLVHVGTVSSIANTEESSSTTYTEEEYPTAPFIPVTGAGSWHHALDPLYLSSASSEEKNSLFAIQFSDADFYTLEPGEVESFQLAVECKLPGIYHLSLDIPYTYLTESNVFKYSDIPPIVCPDKATYWSWWEGFYLKHEYSWDGGKYIPR